MAALYVKIASFLLFLLVLLSQECHSQGLWSWIFGNSYSKNSNKNQLAVDTNKGSEAGKQVAVPFEMQTADEKFLAEAEKYGLQISDLDLCHHKVILHLKQSCASLTEEEIAKLSVQLLNCQSSSEGRPIYRCDASMTLKECTRNMDQNTWNAYHIISNRARAVCYSARQQQFAAKTEMTVNKLVWTSEHQLGVMKKLEQGQEHVGHLTNHTLQIMSLGQKDLMERQERLKSVQQHIQSFVVGNLRELTKEKALIAAGQKELAEMTEQIKTRLDEASGRLANNEEDRRKTHEKILNDLAFIHAKSREVWNKIDNSTKSILQQHAETAAQFSETLENLQQINATVGYLLEIVNQTRQEVDQRLGWLTTLVGGAGDQLSVIHTCLVHGIYLVLGAITASFIQAPPVARITLLLLVPLNALSEVKEGISLSLEAMTFVIFSVVGVYWLVLYIHKMLKKREHGGYLTYNGHIHKLIYNSLDSTSKQCDIKNSGKNMEYDVSKLDDTEEFTEDYLDDLRLNPKEFLFKKLDDSLKNNLKNSQNIDSSGDRVHLTEPDVSSISHLSNSKTSDIKIKAPTSTPGSSTPKTPSSARILPLNVNMSPYWPTKAEVEGVRRDLLSAMEDSSSSVRSSRRSTPVRGSSRSSTPSRRLCTGKNKLGQSCKLTCVSGKEFCRYHQSQE